MNKWKIDIWHGHTIVDTYENEKLDKVMKWYKKHWKSVFNNEGFTFHVYNTDYRKNGEVK